MKISLFRSGKEFFFIIGGISFFFDLVFFGFKDIINLNLPLSTLIWFLPKYNIKFYFFGLFLLIWKLEL